MKLGLMTDGLAHLDRGACLDQVAAWGLDAVEFGVGGWSTSPHLDLRELLGSAAERQRLLAEVADRGLVISALNASGNQLHPGPSGAVDRAKVEGALELAALLGVDSVVLMSGLPAAPGDAYPNWITSSWPPEALEILEWQWRERLVPYWCELAAKADTLGVRLCIEQHGRQCVYNTESFLRLAEAITAGVGSEVAATVGVNFDPSHLWWMGGDAVAAIESLGEHIFHVHAKDTRIEAKARRDGLLDINPVTPVGDRAWNYVSVGAGRSVEEWTAIVTALRDVGYDGVMSIENEDHSLAPEESVRRAVATLRRALAVPAE